MAKRCNGCMKMKEKSPVCEHCGYNENVPNYPHQLPVGTILHGQYRVGKVLGQGGFGITYIGWDMSLEAAIAIKEYYPASFVNRDCGMTLSLSCNGEGAESLFRHNRERFLREAKILAKLSSIPGIVRVQNLFEENNTAYIVMEYVEGIDLKHYIRLQNRVLTAEEILSIMRPILYALHKVHEAELVHRDVSPDNIMILPDGTAKLLDFGAAREVEGAAVDKELPQSTEAILKHGFAPIEQYRRRGNLGPWTDVYAVCATMYYCLTGKVPNSAPERITDDDNVNWHQIPGLSEQQIQTLEKGMAIMPKERTRSMRELHQGLFAQTATGFTQAKQEEKKPEKKPEPKLTYPTHTVSLESDAPESNRRGGSPTLPKSAGTEQKKKKPIGLIAAVLVMVAAVGIFALKPREEAGTTAIPEEKPSISATEPAVTLPLSEEEKQYLAAAALEGAGEYGKAAIAFGKLGDYADARERSWKVWRSIIPDQTVAVGQGGAAVLKNDGSVYHLTATDERQYNASNWSDVVSISVGLSTTVGLKSDGTVVSLGSRDVNHWKDMAVVEASQTNVLGLKSDGTVLVTGHDVDGLCDDWRDIVDISASSHLVGLKSDGTVVAAGKNGNGQCDVESWSDIIAIDSDSYNSTGITIGLKSDGTVVVTGYFDSRTYDLSGWQDIIAVAASVDAQYYFVAGLKSDGTVIAAGSSPIAEKIMRKNWVQTYVKDGQKILGISAGRLGFLGLVSDGTAVSCGDDLFIYQYRHLSDIKIPNCLPNRVADPVEEEQIAAETAPLDNAAAYAAAEALEEAKEYGKAAIAFGKLAGYEDARERSLKLWDKVAIRKTIAAAEKHTVAVKTDGTVVAVGDNTNRICNVESWTDIIAVEAGNNYTYGLCSDGTVVAVGYSSNKYWGVPDVSNWKDIVSIATDMHGITVIGLKLDGTIVSTGELGNAAMWTDIVAVCSGIFGVKADGTVVTTNNSDWTAETAGWTNIVAIDSANGSSGRGHVVGLRADGTVVAAGNNGQGQCNVETWQDIIAIDTGSTYVNNVTYGTVGLKKDGTVVAAGDFAKTDWHDVSTFSAVAALSTSAGHTVALRHDGSVVAVGNRSYGRCDVEDWTDIKLPN